MYKEEMNTQYTEHELKIVVKRVLQDYIYFALLKCIYGIVCFSKQIHSISMKPKQKNEKQKY